MSNAETTILSFIPQRPPFVMIDGLLSSDDKTSRSAFRIAADNIFAENGFFAAPGLVENIAQTAAARAGYIANAENKPVAVGYIGAVKNLEVFFLPKVGDMLSTEIVIENQIFDVTLILGTVSCNGRPAARCEMKIFINQK